MQYLAERPDRVQAGLLDLPRSVDDLFHRFWGGLPATRARVSWQPLVDVLETPEAFMFRVEIPGINPDDVEVTLTGDTLRIRGEKVVDQKLDEHSWCLNERIGGRFERAFTLPVPVSANEIEAEARNGILAIRVTKAKEAQPRKVTIKQT